MSYGLLLLDVTTLEALFPQFIFSFSVYLFGHTCYRYKIGKWKNRNGSWEHGKVCLWSWLGIRELRILGMWETNYSIILIHSSSFRSTKHLYCCRSVVILITKQSIKDSVYISESIWVPISEIFCFVISLSKASHPFRTLPDPKLVKKSVFIPTKNSSNELKIISRDCSRLNICHDKYFNIS